MKSLHQSINRNSSSIMTFAIFLILGCCGLLPNPTFAQPVSRRHLLNHTTTSAHTHHHHHVHNASSLPDIRQKLKQRFSILKHIALSRAEGTQHHHKHHAKECSTTSFVLITEYQFGNSGNNLISLTNMLWLASILNSTLVLPAYMDTILKPFDLTTLHKAHCFANKVTGQPDFPDKKQGHTVYEVESEDAFWMFRLWNRTVYAPLLPAYNDKLVAELSHHYLRVYSGFWCCPRPDIVAAGEYLIMNHLGGAIVIFRPLPVVSRQP
jgi:hypothetical protein